MSVLNRFNSQSGAIDTRSMLIAMPEREEKQGFEEAIRRIEEVKRNNGSSLTLGGFHIASIPESITQLSHLKRLTISQTRIEKIPDFIGQLVNLEGLCFYDSPIYAIPDSIAKLKKLEILEVSVTKINVIPDSVAELTNLQFLYFNKNHITRIPESLGRLHNLRGLHLDDNQITTVPHSLTRLTKLQEFRINGNPLPDELSAARQRGIQPFFRYLESIARHKVYPRTIKVVLLGEPKSGKTTLLEALNGNMNPCDENRKETIGVNVVTIAKPHPSDGKPMYLSAWDFAGQHMEHATHQFFLTENAIYLILWDARLGAESGKRDLWYWLELLKIRVREPKFLLVATHTEHTPADLNLSEILRNYTGCEGNFPVELSNLHGLKELEIKILALAAQSPSLRAEWPADWLRVRDEIRQIRQIQPSMSPAAFHGLLRKNGITSADGQKDLAGQLHNLGEILYFQEREELSNLVILNPEWVTELIALVVRSMEVREHNGLLRKTDLDRLWKKAKLEPKVRDHLISLMDWFDLTYSTGQRDEPGIVVEALPYSTPENLKKIELPTDRPQMEMIFRFPSLQRHLPPGIPTWGIARAHRLSKLQGPWRDAAAFEDRETNSQAVILSSDTAKEVRLKVSADYPPFFFGRLEAILRDTFRRYRGLVPERRLPCPCQPNCTTSYLYETVLKRWHDRKSVVTCDKSAEDVPIESLLSGARRTDTEAGLLALRADMRRLFTEHLRALNQQRENICPSVFTLLPSRGFTQLDTWIEAMTKREEFELILYCEHDSGWHETAHSVYRFRADQEWFTSAKKGWNRFVGITKYVGPLIKSAGKLSKMLPLEAGAMALEKLPEASQFGAAPLEKLDLTGVRELVDPETRSGLKQLIDRLDSQRDQAKKNGGLYPWLIDDGRLLWLCPDHIKQYRVRA